MKAYMIGLKSSPDVGNEIVFANTVKEARKLATDYECAEEAENWIDIYAKRQPNFDGMENYPFEEIELKKFRDRQKAEAVATLVDGQVEEVAG